jgi:hypothetical protein
MTVKEAQGKQGLEARRVVQEVQAYANQQETEQELRRLDEDLLLDGVNRNTLANLVGEITPVHIIMGLYQRMDDVQVNGHGVWQMAGGKDFFVYRSGESTVNSHNGDITTAITNWSWFVGDRQCMEAGHPAGFVTMASGGEPTNGLWRCTHEWRNARTQSRMYDAGRRRSVGEQPRKNWQQGLASYGWRDPSGGRGAGRRQGVCSRVCSSEEKQFIQRKIEVEKRQALQLAMKARTLMLEGLMKRHSLYKCLGEFILQEGVVVNGRAVWRQQSEYVQQDQQDQQDQRDQGQSLNRQDRPVQDCFLYYANSNEWIVSTQEYMELGDSVGWIKAASTALCPQLVGVAETIGEVVYNDSRQVIGERSSERTLAEITEVWECLCGDGIFLPQPELKLRAAPL